VDPSSHALDTAGHRRAPLDATVVAQVEPRAAEILKNMSAFLAKTPRFTMEAEETYDDVREGGRASKVAALRRITVERPSRLLATASGDIVNRSTWYDGHRLAVLDRDTNRYLSTDAPDTIDGVLDKIAHDYGIVIPLSDFLYANPMRPSARVSSAASTSAFTAPAM
jgi:hypothetical protein